MNPAQADIAKIKAVILYVINRTGAIDFHKFFKILYFAEQYHLVTYGRKIVSDKYVAMDYGPVLSLVYNIFKRKKSNHKSIDAYSELLNAIKIEGHIISVMEKPDMDELSKSDIKCLDRSMDENFDLTMDDLTKKSHQFAYNQARAKKCGKANEIEDLHIAIEGGAKQGMLEYIQESHSLSMMLQ